jgi:RNA polymerase sigma-70 factor, ECF subfamily
VSACVAELPAQCEDARPAEDDLTLVRATKRGHASAFEKLVSKHDRKLLRIAHSVTHNREEAEAAVQEAFCKAYQRLDQFHESAKFSTWLIHILLNEALRLRTAKEESLDRDAQSDSDIFPKDVADWSHNPKELYSAAVFREILIKCLLRLPPALRIIFVLRDIEELSIDDTGEVLGLSPVAIKARLLRARLQLRERLTRYFKTPDGELPAVTLKNMGI